MAITQLLFPKGNFIDEIELDAIITEGTTVSSQITVNPVQSISDTNDHIIIKPKTFNMEGVVSNASSTTFGQLDRNAFTPRKDQETWEALLELHANKTVFTLVQGLRSYPNVTILSLNENQDKDTSNALFFTAALQEILSPPGTLTSSPETYADQATFDQASPAVSGGFKQLK